MPQGSPRNVQPYALNPGIIVKIKELDGDPATGPGGSLLVGDTVRVVGTWTAPEDAVGGDQFFINFPRELEVEAQSFTLNGDDGEIWGNCEIDLSTNRVTCTLTDIVNGLSDVGGTFTMFSEAVERVTTETIDFGVNGEVQAVDLPGEGGISDGVVIGDATKTGAFTPDRQAITWTIEIPGSELAALADEDGAVTLEDDLSPNLALCVDADRGRPAPTLRAGRGNDMPIVPGGVTVTQEEAGSPLSIVIDTGADFNPEQLYRVQYTTCTTSGVVDPAGTQYSNSVDIGGATVGKGIGQDWTPTTAPSKSGSWAGGSRFSRLNWTVTVPGTMAPDGVINIAEQLSSNHAVCSDGLGLTVTMRDYLPLPGANAPVAVNVTDQFTLTGQPAEGAASFTLGLTWNGTGEFDPEKYYVVQYRTCVTSEQVPNNDVTFSNAATVNGAPVDASVTGHNFPGSKRGTFNTAPREVGGEIQPANTTIDWSLDVPGHDLENLGTNAVINDTFSGTLAVCEIGDDLKQSLNLSVIARDFQGGGPIERRDLTADTAVALNGNTLQFTLPKEEGDYNREVVYDIDYTLCTASGGVDSRGTSYTNEATWQGARFNRSVERSSGAGGTGQGVARGSFSLQKLVAPFSEPFPIDETVFSVRVEEFAPGVDPESGAADETYTVEVKADGTPVSGFNARGAGWQIRLTEINLPHGNGVFFEPGIFHPADGVELNEDRTEALITIQPRTNVAVELVNNAQLGGARVSKEVIGNAAGELTGDEKFVIQANVDTGVEGSGTELREFTLRDGQFYDLGDLPIGTTVTFNEVRPADTDRITWSDPVFEPAELVISADQSANVVTVTNEVSITQGSFTISKDLRGPEADNAAVPESFEVLATWTDANGATQQKPLLLPSNGNPIPFGEDLPGGTQVTLTESVPADGNGLAWGTPSYVGDVTVDGAGSAVLTVGQEPGTVTVRNFVDTNDGTLRLAKQVSGEAADAVGDAEFTVEARWRDGTSYRTEVLTLREGESTPLGLDLPVGTEVTFTETAIPEIAGLDWGSPSWATDPAGDSWLVTGPDDTATGIVSDDPTGGRLITLTNEAGWQTGSLAFEKFLFDGEDPVPAVESDLPDGTEFRVRIDGISPALPAGTDFPAVGRTITLNSDNGWSWESGDVLPTGTVVTFSEVDPAPLDGTDWARPFYYVAADAGEPEDRNSVEIESGERAEVEIRNRPIPTADVLIEKLVTGAKGEEVAADKSSTFEVTATWTDPDDEARTCVLDVRPNGTMRATADCDAVVVGDRVQFPLDTEITFVETDSRTRVDNVSWGDVSWGVADGSADTDELDGEPAGALVTLTGDSDERVTLELENEANLTEGTFGISKQITGPEQHNDAVPTSFEVLATWTDADGTQQEETLMVPSNGATVEFPYDLPGGTEVTLTEVVPADGNGLAWGLPSYSGDVTINEAGSAVLTIDQEEIRVVVGNYVDTNDGTLRLTKQVSGEAAEAVGEEAEYTVEANWQAGTEFGTTLLTVREGESTPLGVNLPVGTQVTFSEIGLPEIPGVEWGGSSWGTNPAGASWLRPNRDGTATGIVSDDPNDGRIITLTNEALWQFGSVGFEKFVLDGEDPVPASEAGLPADAEFEVRIDGIDPALPADVDFPAVGDTVTLDAANGWSWESGEVLPRDTVVTFSEVDPAPLDGTDWARPTYFVTADAGEPGPRNTATIVPGEHAVVEIHNRPIPTADVDIDKIVTGPKGRQVAGHESTTFQVTTSWTDVDGEERSCILDVTPNGGMTPTVDCDAVVVGNRVQFPVDTEIAFVETGAHTDVSNVNWGDVTWSVAGGGAEASPIADEPTGVVVTLTGDEPVSLELENETSSRGLIFIPIPIPLPPFDGGSSTPPGPGAVDPSGPQSPGEPAPSGQSRPDKPQRPSGQEKHHRPSGQQKPSGHNGAPGKPAPARPGKSGQSLAVTGANVAWLGGTALVLIAGGTWLILRNRRNQAVE
ncbi:peptidase [Dietzia aurantiaca]|uniref:DUF5979 domain-containing protein n=1 Tax=Dietzia aurantiaca TaxID=983873 RepID=UPI001E55181C|nr:DUF5979 domain-containing protein [Dietzia aurantiaca]MCD2262733.1 peptidase [Dietzia aurantiaca]